MERSIQVSVQAHRLRAQEEEVRRLVEVLDMSPLYEVASGELSIVFVDREMITSLHAQFMDDPTPTDVITFKGDPAMDFAGEICICIDQAEEVAKALGRKFSEELTLYLVHGWLHLAGLGDKTPEEAKHMRVAENQMMGVLKEQGFSQIFSLTENER